MKIILSILAVVVLVSCKCSKEASNTSSSSTSVDEQSSTITGLDGTFYVQKVYDLSINDPKAKITFGRNKNSVTGYTGCNQFSGQVYITNPKISISKLVVTEAFCQDKNQQEKVFLKALNNASTYTYNSNGITFKNLDGNIILKASSRGNQ